MADKEPCCQQQVSLAKQRSCWMLGLEKVPQITAESQKTLFSFFLESACCMERCSPYSFADFTNAFSLRISWMDNPQVGFFIQIWEAERNKGPQFCLHFFHRYKVMLQEHPLFLRYFETEYDQNSLCLHSLS